MPCVLYWEMCRCTFSLSISSSTFREINIECFESVVCVVSICSHFCSGVIKVCAFRLFSLMLASLLELDFIYFIFYNLYFINYKLLELTYSRRERIY